MLFEKGFFAGYTGAAVAAAMAIAMSAATPAIAQDYGIYEANVGVLHHDTDNLWSGFRRESGIDLNAEILFDGIGDALGGSLHPYLGASVNLSGDTSKAFAGLRWRRDLGASVFFGIGLGAAVHDGETDLVRNDKKALGSRVLFHIPIELGVRLTDRAVAAIYFDHVSNAYLADANEGMDTLGLRLGYRF